MMGRRIVAIVGSSKFKAEHLGVAQRETLRGSIVLLAGFWHHVDKESTPTSWATCRAG